MAVGGHKAEGDQAAGALTYAYLRKILGAQDDEDDADDDAEVGTAL